MLHDNASTNPELIALSPQTLYRGLYVRVARKLGVDPSYVSRVARGERQSPEVEGALSQEIERIIRKLSSPPKGGRKAPKVKSKRLRTFVEEKGNSLHQEWLKYTGRS